MSVVRYVVFFGNTVTVIMKEVLEEDLVMEIMEITGNQMVASNTLERTVMYWSLII